MKNEGRAKYSLVSQCCVFIIIFLACTSTAIPGDKKGDKEDGNTIVAKVNGKEIYMNQLTPEVEKALAKYKKYGMQDLPHDLRKRLRKEVLDNLITQELLYQVSQESTIPDIEEKINEKIKIMKDKYPSEKQFEASLKAKNLNINGLRESVRKSIYIDNYLEKKGINNPEVPETDIKKYYDEHKENFKIDESIRASHILIKAGEDATSEKKKQAQKKIEEIRQMIIEGKDFAGIAKEYSECDSAPKGGDLGYISRGYMPKEFDFNNVAFSLKKDELSNVVQTRFGYHIIKVVDKKSEGVIPFNETKAFIGKYLKEGLTRQKLASHIEGLKEKAKIEIFLN